MLECTKLSSTLVSTTDVVTVRTQNYNDDRRFAPNVALRFEKEDEFAAKIGEDVIEFIAKYIEATVDYELCVSQKRHYFHKLLGGDAKKFYKTLVKLECSSFEYACVKIENEYSSIAIQNIVRKYPQTLTVISTMEQKSCNVSEALDELRESITRFTLQWSRTHRS